MKTNTIFFWRASIYISETACPNTTLQTLVQIQLYEVRFDLFSNIILDSIFHFQDVYEHFSAVEDNPNILGITSLYPTQFWQLGFKFTYVPNLKFWWKLFRVVLELVENYQSLQSWLLVLNSCWGNLNSCWDSLNSCWERNCNSTLNRSIGKCD